MNNAKQTPLIDLLRRVPPDARGEYAHSEIEHSFIPYGRLCCEAADEIERLQARVAELERDAARYRWLRQERYMFREGAVVTCDEQAETVALWVKCPVTNCICEVDAAIDADMKEQP